MKELLKKVHWSKIKCKISEKGLLCAALHVLWYILKNLFELFIYKKRIKNDDVESKRWIFNEWEKQWNKDYDSKEEDNFYKLFKYDYESTCTKIRRNKRKNFQMKFINMLPFIIGVILFLTGIFIYNAQIFCKTKNLEEILKKIDWSFSIFNTILYTAAIILTAVISKWIGVKKYQETWIRHSNHKYFIDMEMYKFIERMDEYSYMGRKEKFKRNIMKSWDKNQNKFFENMKNEEKVEGIIKSVKK